jgi:hypothetical protein
MLRCKASDMLRNEAYLSVRRRWGFSGSRLGPGKALVRGKYNRSCKPSISERSNVRKTTRSHLLSEILYKDSRIIASYPVHAHICIRLDET